MGRKVSLLSIVALLVCSSAFAAFRTDVLTVTSSETVASTDINGGTIDGTQIGASSPTYATFTQIHATQQITGPLLAQYDSGNLPFLIYHLLAYDYAVSLSNNAYFLDIVGDNNTGIHVNQNPASNKSASHIDGMHGTNGVNRFTDVDGSGNYVERIFVNSNDSTPLRQVNINEDYPATDYSAAGTPSGTNYTGPVDVLNYNQVEVYRLNYNGAIDINAGTIDGTTVGSSSPADATFNSVSAGAGDLVYSMSTSSLSHTGTTTLTAKSSTVTPLVINGAASQSAKYLSLNDSTNAELLNIGSNGSINITKSAVSQSINDVRTFTTASAARGIWQISPTFSWTSNPTGTLPLESIFVGAFDNRTLNLTTGTTDNMQGMEFNMVRSATFLDNGISSPSPLVGFRNMRAIQTTFQDQGVYTNTHTTHRNTNSTVQGWGITATGSYAYIQDASMLHEFSGMKFNVAFTPTNTGGGTLRRLETGGNMTLTGTATGTSLGIGYYNKVTGYTDNYSLVNAAAAHNYMGFDNSKAMFGGTAFTLPTAAANYSITGNYATVYFDGTGLVFDAEQTAGGEYFVFNESGSDIDFRVESDGNTHRIFSDAANNVTAIGTSTTTIIGSPIAELVVGDSSTSKRAIYAQSASSDIFYGVSGSNIVNFTTSSNLFNDGGADVDFRVESDNNANGLFVDASVDRVGVMNSAPDYTFDVTGSIRASTSITSPIVSTAGALITGGTINGTTIGATSAVDATFNSVEANVMVKIDTVVISALGSASPAGKLKVVSDGLTFADCTAGGGTSYHICISNGTTWVNS